MNFSVIPARVHAACENCHRAVEIDCEGFAGPAGYMTYNELTCPHCGKITRARTPGAILAVRKSERTEAVAR